MLSPISEGPREIRDFFNQAGFTQEHFRESAALRDLQPASRLSKLPILIERTDKASALNVLLRWFFLGRPLASESLAGLVPPRLISLMLDCGLLVREGERLAPTVMLSPFEGYLFAADVPGRLESPEGSDLVLWPNLATRILRMFTVRKPAGETLDLGSGCGVLAILAAGHSRRAAGTDLNPRAAEFGAFNAWLNQVENVEWLTGDTFDPARGRQFDRILANPPFFVTPSSGQLYCENSMELDGYCRRLVREAPAYLNENGFLQMELEWVQVRGQSWRDRLAEWMLGSGCDAWLLRNYSSDAAEYAAGRIGAMVPWSPETAGKRFEDWMGYYNARGVEQIHGGLLAMRKRSGNNWFSVEEASELELREPFGESILELFANRDRLEADRTSEHMLAWRPRLAPDARIEQKLRPDTGGWVITAMTLGRPGALPASLAVEPRVAGFLAQCDGSRTLEQLAHELAGVVKADLAQVCEQCCTVIRTLAERRLVLL